MRHTLTGSPAPRARGRSPVVYPHAVQYRIAISVQVSPCLRPASQRLTNAALRGVAHIASSIPGKGWCAGDTTDGSDSTRTVGISYSSRTDTDCAARPVMISRQPRQDEHSMQTSMTRQYSDLMAPEKVPILLLIAEPDYFHSPERQWVEAFNTKGQDHEWICVFLQGQTTRGSGRD